VSFPALACDYDGTLAVHDRIPPATIAALRRARVVPPPRAIRHIRHLTKSIDQGVASHHRFFFRGPGGGVIASAGTLGELVECLRTLPSATIAHHAPRGDFSRWIHDVFQDDVLADRVAKVERRWCRGELAHFVDEVGALIRRACAVAGPST
jgi:hypothetical protein